MRVTTVDSTKEWTLEDYLLLGEMNTPCQLINGELIMSPSPAPLHQIISGNLYDILKACARKTQGTVFYAPLDLYIDSKNVFQPDLIYISRENKGIISQRGIEGVPDLVIEIISPSNVFTDRNRKKTVYQQIGVGEYWIVDPGNRTLEIYKKGERNPDTPFLYLVDEGIVTSTVLNELSFDFKEIFSSLPL